MSLAETLDVKQSTPSQSVSLIHHFHFSPAFLLLTCYFCVGFWGLDLVIAPGPDGKLRPVLVDLNVGRLCGGHYPYLFAKNNNVTFKSYLSYHVPDNLSEEER